MVPFSQYFHILNPNSHNRSGVQRFFKKHPEYKFKWVDRSSHPTHLETIVEWALVEKQKNIAIWGGDGTLSRVCQALYELDAFSKITVCWVPAGTGNDFCRQFGFGKWPSWVERYKKNLGSVNSMDLGLLDFAFGKRVFLNNAGFGRSRQAMSRNRSHPLQDIMEFQKHKMEVEWESGDLHQFETYWALLGIVFNSPFFNKGMFFDKSISPTNGTLAAYLIPPQSRLSLLMRFALTKLKVSLTRNGDMRLDATGINLRSEDFLFPQVDGEAVTKRGAKELRFTVLKNKCKLWVPREIT